MGRVLAKVELINWVYCSAVLGKRGSIESVHYLEKGFYTVKFKEVNAIKAILDHNSLKFYGTPVCVALGIRHLNPSSLSDKCALYGLSLRICQFGCGEA